MKGIVYYYSFEGNTAFAAETIQTVTGIKVERLIVEKEPPKTGLRKFLLGGKSALMKQNPGLKPVMNDPDDYEFVVLAYPIWAGTFPPAIHAFLKTYSLKGKTVSVITTSASGNAEKSAEKIKQSLPDSEFAGFLSLVNPLQNREEVTRKIKQWAEAFA